MSKVKTGAVWEDREVLFDLPFSHLKLRAGEKIFDRIEPMEDTKGNSGSKGRMVITNLRIIWHELASPRINISIGLNCVLATNTKVVNSGLRGTTQALYVLAVYKTNRYEFIFTNLSPNCVRHYTSIVAVHKAFTCSRLYRDLKLRGAIITNKQLRMLPLEKISLSEHSMWNLSSESGNLGKMVVTNVRVVWYADINDTFNVSMPYITIENISIRDSKFGKALVFVVRQTSGGYVLGFRTDHKERLHPLLAELKTLHQAYTEKPIFGVELNWTHEASKPTTSDIEDFEEIGEPRGEMGPSLYLASQIVRQSENIETQPIYSPYNIVSCNALRGVVALVEVECERQAQLLRDTLNNLGATVNMQWNNFITHVIWSEGGSNEVRATARALAARVVSPLWVDACVAAKKIVPDKKFIVPAKPSDLPSPKAIMNFLEKAANEDIVTIESDEENRNSHNDERPQELKVITGAPAVSKEYVQRLLAKNLLSSTSKEPHKKRRRRRPHNYPKIVLTHMSLTERRKVIKAIASLNGRLKKNVSDTTTHILVGSGRNDDQSLDWSDDNAMERAPRSERSEKAPRTVKALLGAARGCWVLKAQWAIDSSNSKKWEDPYVYEVPQLKDVSEVGNDQAGMFGMVSWLHHHQQPIYVHTAGAQDYSPTESPTRGPSEDWQTSHTPLNFSQERASFLTMFSFTEKPMNARAERQAIGWTKRYGYDVFWKRCMIVSPDVRQRSGLIQLLLLCGATIANVGSSCDVTIGDAPGEICPKWVYDSVTAGRMRNTRTYINL